MKPSRIFHVNYTWDCGFRGSKILATTGDLNAKKLIQYFSIIDFQYGVVAYFTEYLGPYKLAILGFKYEILRRVW